MASVTYDHVVKRYTADVTVVKDFNVEIKDKEFMVLVGPSGCGKSTALRMLAGLEAISEGKILIGDRVVNNVAAKDRDIAMVFQSYALYPHMSVYDNMAFPLQMAHMKKSEIDKRVQRVAHSRTRQLPQAQASSPVGRPAPARRLGSSHRAQP